MSKRRISDDITGMPRTPRSVGVGGGGGGGKERNKANLKTMEEGEDSRPITVTSDSNPPGNEPTPEIEKDGADLEAHPLSISYGVSG